MIDRLRSILKTDGLLPTGAIFPSIDTDRLAQELRLKERGNERGASNSPDETEDALDSVEMSIVTRIEEIRRKGLENYSLNREAYTRRLNSATAAHVEVKSIARRASGDFHGQITSFRSQMTKLVMDVQNWQAAVDNFQKKHGIDRPAYSKGNLLIAATILIACVLVETLLNGYLFAQKNELGLLGGAMVAGLVSVVNVGVSTVAGLFSRLVRHRNFFAKLAGIAIIISWIASMVGLNLAVAHFRDAIETLGGWSEAATASLDHLKSDPLGLRSIESWLLMAWGSLISIVAFLKFVYFGEPYPGYQRISSRRDQALSDYAYMLDDAVSSLEGSRDDAIDELQEAGQIVQEKIGDAVDALYGRHMLKGHLQAFLDQSNIQTNALLSVYRDANRNKRTKPAPKHFDTNYSFSSFEETEPEAQAKTEARTEVSAVMKVVEDAIEDIHREHKQMLADFPRSDIIVGLNLMTGRRDGTSGGGTGSSQDSATSLRGSSNLLRDAEAIQLTEHRPS